MLKKILKSSIIALSIAGTSSHARELDGFSNIKFGMKFDEVKTLISQKSGFEIWKNKSNEKQLKYTATLAGRAMSTNIFFKNSIVDGFNVSTRHVVANKDACIDDYLALISQIEKRYGKATNPSVSQGGFFETDFGFSNNRQINVFGNYDVIIDKCFIVVGYKNSSLTRQMPPVKGNYSTSDQF